MTLAQSSARAAAGAVCEACHAGTMSTAPTEKQSDHRCEDRGRSDRECRPGEDRREPETNRSAGNGADDADHHSFGERQPEQCRGPPSRRRKDRLLAGTITKVHRQNICDAEGTKEQRQ